MPTSFLKILTGLALIRPLEKNTQTTILPIPLPPECKDFKLIKGDPWMAKTLILGEEHMTCDVARYSCTQSLLAAMLFEGNKEAIDPKRTTFLFEQYGHDQQILCKEENHEKLSDDCRGWNTDGKQYLQDALWYWKAQTLDSIKKQVGDEFGKWLSEPEKSQKTNKITYLEKCITQSKKTIASLEKKYKIFMEKNAKNKPNLFSRQIINLEIEKFKQSRFEKILEDTKKNKSSYDVVVDMNTERDEYIKLSNSTFKGIRDNLKKHNKAMSKAITKANDPKKITVVYAGDAHVNKNSTLTKQQAKAVEELYDDLDKFADRNPYAVLSCTL